MSRSPLRFVVLAVIALLLPGRASADIIIDFESLADGEVLSNQIPGLTFSNATVLTAGISLNEFEFPPASGANVVFDDFGPMHIAFSSPLGAFGGYFTYAVPLALEAFDPLNNSLGTVLSSFAGNMALSGDVGSTPNEFLEVAFGNIASVTITGDPFGGSFVLDDAVLTQAAVPEPAMTWLMLSVGAAVLGRRRMMKRPDVCG